MKYRNSLVELKYDRLYSFQWYLDAGISNTKRPGLCHKPDLSNSDERTV